ncbi:hypothetical protein BSKO_03923 [Bryopsis sp. KO-2023]|nr:hypothetical protein BSKO_03923 [Bryopsis sp. KO-2023]
MLKLSIFAVFLVVGASAGLSVSVKPAKPLCPDGRPPIVCVRAPCPVCGEPIPPGPCPPGVPQAACKADPCDVTKCPAFPNAKCVSNFCGGCNADFFVNGKKVDCNSGCPPDKPEVQCFADPCQVTQCDAFPNAKCVSNFCGGCNADFFVDGEKVDCNKKPCQCANIVDPCDPITNPVCPRFPNAVCKSNCCEREWFVNGKQVDCTPIDNGPCLKKGATCPNFSAPTPWLSRKLGRRSACCDGLECCACGPPVVRPGVPPPLTGTCQSRCICPIG